MLVFVDADVLIPLTLLEVIHVAMSDPQCVGGGVDTDYRPRRVFVRLYLRAWRLLARATRMVQGATQFCRKSAFEMIGGYGEDRASASNRPAVTPESPPPAPDPRP